MNEMAAERRKWIEEQIMEQRLFTSFPKAPENLKGFYDRNKVEEKGKDAEATTGKKSKADKAAKAIKDSKKKKKGKGDKDASSRLFVGPSEVNKKFDVFDREYRAIWENREEDENPNQIFDKKLLKAEFKPAIME